jgi:2-C-methyl-D-erythritol 2,4-cyclodiphosphate synthase
VLLHAICDALIGAAALGDIGKHFPDTDPRYKGADSRVLLRAVVQLLHRNLYRIVNVDCTVIAQAPKLAPYIEAMRRNIADDLDIAFEDINVKAKTAEHLGSLGRKEGIAAQAVALIRAVEQSGGD